MHAVLHRPPARLRRLPAHHPAAHRRTSRYAGSHREPYVAWVLPPTNGALSAKSYGARVGFALVLLLRGRAHAGMARLRAVELELGLP